jgi:hypothetical protein
VWKYVLSSNVADKLNDNTEEIRRNLKQYRKKGYIVKIDGQQRMRYPFDKQGNMYFYKPITV